MRVVALVALLLAGCAPTLHEVASQYTGITDLEQFRRRHNDCVRMSRAVVNLGGGLLGAAATAANVAGAHSDFDQCMVDGGYRRIPTPEEIAGAEAFKREHCENVHRGHAERIGACMAR